MSQYSADVSHVLLCLLEAGVELNQHVGERRDRAVIVRDSACLLDGIRVSLGPVGLGIVLVGVRLLLIDRLVHLDALKLRAGL